MFHPVLAGLTVFVFTGLAPADQDEPSIQGKTLTEWMKALDDQKLETRLQAVNALRQLGPKAAPAASKLVETLKDRDHRLRTQVQFALQTIGADAIPALVDGLKSKDSTVRAVCAAVLYPIANRTKIVIDALRETLRDKDLSVAYYAAWGLARVHPEGVNILVEFLKEDDAERRFMAIQALANFGGMGKEILGAAKLGIKDKSDKVRMQATSLAKRFGQEGVPVLIAALKDSNWDIRNSAVQNLQGLGREAVLEAMPGLRESLKDSPSNLRLTILQFLTQTGENAKMALPELTDLIGDRDPLVRAATVNVLTGIGKNAMPVLKLALGHKDSSVRASVVAALTRLAGDGVPLLRSALADEASAVRLAAADALSSLGVQAKDAAQDLEGRLQDKDSLVRLACAGALWRVTGKAEGSLRVLLEAVDDPDQPLRERAERSLAAVGAAATPGLVEALKKPDVLSRRRAARALLAVGVPAKESMPDLIKTLGDDNREVRHYSTLALIRMGAANIDMLLEALKDEKDTVRAGAAQVFIQVPMQPRKDVTEALVAALKDKSPMVRVRAAEAAFRFGQNKEAYQALFAAAEDEDAAIRRLAIAAFLAVRSRGGVATTPADWKKSGDVLASALKDKDLGVRLEASRGLVFGYYTQQTSARREEIATTVAEALRKFQGDDRKLALQTLTYLGGDGAAAVPALAEVLADADSGQRSMAAYLLGTFGAEAREAVPQLRKTLGDAVLAVRQLSAQALHAIGPDAHPAVPELLQALADDDILLKLSAVQALGRIGAPAKPAVEGLRALLRNPPGITTQPDPGRPWVAPGLPHGKPRPLHAGQTIELVLIALGQLGPAAEAAVPEVGQVMLKDEAHRRAAARVLAQIGGAAAEPLIAGLSDKNATTRALCVEALGRLESVPAKHVQTLTAGIQDKDPEVRRQTLFALVQLGPAVKAAAPALLEVVSNKELDAETRGLAAQALAELGAEPKQSVPALIDLLKEKDDYLRLRAAAALGVLGPKARDAEKALADLARDESSAIRRAAARALEAIRSMP